ncbi:MAG TPA: hypothetical protein VMS17_33885 [Gemmataceae bacterium]|nr:hypothetical protein [Gemmataceae bacterium]
MTARAQAAPVNGEPRSAAEVRRQMADLAKVRDAARAYGARDFASRAGLDAMLGHEQSLLEELRAAEMLESGSATEIVFDGYPVQDHAIQAGFLGVMLIKNVRKKRCLEL